MIEQNNNSQLGKLYYIIGKQATPIRIFHNYFIGKDQRFSKWVHYIDASSKDIEQATHRTILKNEIVLDFDPEINQTKQELILKVKLVCKDLKRKKIEYQCFDTGSRGFHIHLFIDDMINMSVAERKAYRTNIIKFFGAELQKSSDNSPIALEGVTHWKSGKVKKRCDW